MLDTVLCFTVRELLVASILEVLVIAIASVLGIYFGDKIEHYEG